MRQTLRVLLVRRHSYAVPESEDVGAPFTLELAPDAEFTCSLEDGILVLEVSVRTDLTDLRDVDATDPDLVLVGYEGDQPREQLELIEDALEFLFGFELRRTDTTRSAFVAETDAEAAFLASREGVNLSTETATVTNESRSVNPGVNETTVRHMLDRMVAVRLYGDARRAHSPSSAFRDLRRVLEAAFQRKDSDLIDLLSRYPDALRMDFNRAELKKLHTLRGRASHSQSKSGLDELRYVDEECRKHRLRLSHLAERVILSKKTWGTPTVETHPDVPPVRFFAGADGSLVMLIPPAT